MKEVKVMVMHVLFFVLLFQTVHVSVMDFENLMLDKQGLRLTKIVCMTMYAVEGGSEVQDFPQLLLSYYHMVLQVYVVNRVPTLKEWRIKTALK